MFTPAELLTLARCNPNGAFATGDAAVSRESLIPPVYLLAAATAITTGVAGLLVFAPGSASTHSPATRPAATTPAATTVGVDDTRPQGPSDPPGIIGVPASATGG